MFGQRQYYCLVAGLREYALDSDTKGIDAAAIRDEILAEVSPRDARLVWLLDAWFACERFLRRRPELAQPVWDAYYAKCARSRSTFLRRWAAFDRDLRMRAVSLVADEPNLIEKERKLDRIRWDRVDELSAFDYFDMDAILAYLVKLNLITRWMRLDEKTGRDMLHQLLDTLNTQIA